MFLRRETFTAWNKPKNQICFHDWNNKLSLKDKQLTLFCCCNGPNNEAVNRGHNVKMYFASTNTFFKPTQFLPTQHDLHVLSIRIMTEAAKPRFSEMLLLVLCWCRTFQRLWTMKRCLMCFLCHKNRNVTTDMKDCQIIFPGSPPNHIPDPEGSFTFLYWFISSWHY